MIVQNPTYYGFGDYGAGLGSALGAMQSQLQANAAANMQGQMLNAQYGLQNQAQQNQFTLGQQQNNLLGTSLANQLALGKQGLGNQLTLGKGQLDLSRFLGGNQFELGKQGLGNELTLGQGRLDLERFLGGNQYNLGQMGLTNQYNLGVGNLGLQNTIAGQQYDLGRMGQTNQYNLGAGRLGVDYNLGQGQIDLARDLGGQRNQLLQSLFSGLFGVPGGGGGSAAGSGGGRTSPTSSPSYSAPAFSMPSASSPSYSAPAFSMPSAWTPPTPAATPTKNKALRSAGGAVPTLGNSGGAGPELRGTGGAVGTGPGAGGTGPGAGGAVGTGPGAGGTGPGAGGAVGTGPGTLNTGITPGPMFSPGAAQSIAAGQGATQQAAGNIYGNVMPGLAQGAFNYQSPTGFTFSSGGNQVGQATVGAPQGVQGASGMGQGSVSGMDINPTQFWGQDQASQLQNSLGNMAQATMPYLQGAQPGLASNFMDYMKGMGGRIFSDAQRAGTQAQANHNLAAMTANAGLQNNLMGAMGQFYGNRLNSNLANALFGVQQIGALS